MAAARRVRIALLVAGGAAAVIATVLVLLRAQLRVEPRVSAEWQEFSLGIPYGNWTTINPNLIRSHGMTVKTALSVAHNMPGVRVIGPDWLNETRYAITAVVSPEAKEHFRPLFLQELKKLIRF